jgi:hypothetical protein
MYGNYDTVRDNGRMNAAVSLDGYIPGTGAVLQPLGSITQDQVVALADVDRLVNSVLSMLFDCLRFDLILEQLG